jgi:hypothetical protein
MFYATSALPASLAGALEQVERCHAYVGEHGDLPLIPVAGPACTVRYAVSSGVQQRAQASYGFRNRNTYSCLKT